MVTPLSDSRPVAGWIAVFTSFALFALTVVLFGASQNAAVIADEHTAAIDASQLDVARLELELAATEVVLLRMLDGVNAEGDRSSRLDAAAGRISSVATELETIADGKGPAAVGAAAILEDADPQALSDPLEASLDELFYISEESARFAGAADLVVTRRDAIQQLSFVTVVPWYVVIEGIAGDVSVNERAVNPAAATFVDDMIVIVRTEGGWFGADANLPLDDAVWIEIDDARERLPGATASLNQLTAASPIIEYDSWMRNLGNTMTEPPDAFLNVLDDADALHAELSVVVAQLVDGESAQQAEALASEESKRRLMLVAAGVTAVLALVALLIGVGMISRSSRSARESVELAMSDALTGVGNRHELNRRTRANTENPRFGYHVVVMVDVDRFKLVNDVHGHDAGDAILVEIAARLTQTGERASLLQAGAEFSVIRMGGDEFLLTVHGADVLDVAAIRADLDISRNDVLDHESGPISLGFSIGLVQAAGRNELAELMRAADLAVYDDKMKRDADRAALR